MSWMEDKPDERQSILNTIETTLRETKNSNLAYKARMVLTAIEKRSAQEQKISEYFGAALICLGIPVLALFLSFLYGGISNEEIATAVLTVMFCVGVWFSYQHQALENAKRQER